MLLDDGTDTGDTAIARTGRRLAWAGVSPFAILALWLYGIAPDHPWREQTIVLLVAYGSIVLSFLGGVRWGLALTARDDQRRLDLFIGTVPALAGWLALVIPAPFAFAYLAVAYAAQGAWDSLAAHSGEAPRWYGRMRVKLTVAVVAALIVAFVATSQ